MKRRRQRLRDDPAWMRKVRQLRKRGMPYSKIAAEVSSDAATVYYALNPRDTADGRPSQAGCSRTPRTQQTAEREAAKQARAKAAAELAAEAERILVLRAIVQLEGLHRASRLEEIPVPVLRAALELAS